MVKWLRERRWLLASIFLVVTLLSLLSPQVVSRVDYDNRVGIGIGNERVITLGHIAYAAGDVDYTYDGVADDVQFQAALNALPATGGRLVDVSAVQKNFTATVTRAIPGVVIIGAGQGSYFANDGLTALFTAGGNNWKFQDLSTDAGGISMGATTGWQWIHVDDGSTVYDYRSPAGSIVNGAFVASSVSATSVVTSNVSLNDSGTRIDIPAANTMRFVTSGVPAMVINNDGGFAVGRGAAANGATLALEVAGAPGFVSNIVLYDTVAGGEFVFGTNITSSRTWQIDNDTGVGGTPGSKLRVFSQDNITAPGTLYLAIDTVNTTWSNTNQVGLVLGGALNANSQDITGLDTVQFTTAGTQNNIKRDDEDDYLFIMGGSAATSGVLGLFGRTHATYPGQIWFETPNNVAAETLRMSITGGVATAVVTWSNATHSGIVFTASSPPQFTDNSTGANTPLLGANSPATDNTTPYTWLRVLSGDGSTVYIPAWK